MRKLVSFTLYGNNPKYVAGMYKNLDLREKFYPDWETIIYHDNSLGESVLEDLSSRSTMVNVDGCGILASMWRFFAHDETNTEAFIVRDSDSRIMQREAEAVNEWMESDAILHIMRDHPHHGYPINGGMWGMKPDPSVSLRNLCLQYQNGKRDEATNRDSWWMVDMHFLRDVIYPLANESNSKIHVGMDFMDNVTWQNEHWAKDFLSSRNEDRNFIGEVFDFVNGEERRGYQYNEL